MPRPGRSNTSGKSSTILKPSNPLTGWIKKLQDRRRAKVEAAARELSDSRAENENVMVAKLTAINFTDSMLPPEALDRKRTDTQPMGDLEFDVQCAIALLRDNTQDYSGIDTSELDAILLTIIDDLDQAVRAGQERRAYAASAAVIVGLDQIRNKIPTINESMRQGFIDASVTYLSNYSQLISVSGSLDMLEGNQKRLEELQQRRRDDLEAETDRYADRLIGSEEFRAKYKSIENQTSLADWASWDDETRELYRWLVNQRIQRNAIEFGDLNLNMTQKEINKKLPILQNLQTALAQIPVVNDPDELNKYMEMVEETFKQAAQADAEFAEMGELMDKMHARIESMYDSQGSILERRMLEDAMQELVERTKKKQMEAAGLTDDAEDRNASLRSIGLMTEAELQQLQQKRMEEQRRAQIQAQQQKTAVTNKTRLTN